MVIAAGPRVVSSTMGVATPLTIPVPHARGADHDQHPRPGHRGSPVRRVLRHVRPLRQSEHVHGGADRGGECPRQARTRRRHVPGAGGFVGGPRHADQRVDHLAGLAAVGARREVVPGDLQPARGGGDLQLRDRPGRQRPDPHGHRDGRADLLGQPDGSERRRSAGRDPRSTSMRRPGRSTARRSSRLTTRPRCRSSSPARASSAPRPWTPTATRSRSRPTARTSR